DRLQLVVDEQDLGIRLAVRALQLLELALAEVGAPFRPGPVLDQLSDRLHECRECELPQLGELVPRIDSLGQHGGDEPALECGIRLALDHGRIMPGAKPVVVVARYRLIPMKLFPALAATGTYPFVKLEEAKRRLAAAGVDLIDFGKGDPREPTDPLIRRARARNPIGSPSHPPPGRPPGRQPAAAGGGGA